MADQHGLGADQERQLMDAVCGQDMMYEWFTEDEVEALQQAQANPGALLSLLQQVGSRVAMDEYFDDGDSDADMWCTDDGDSATDYDDADAWSDSVSGPLRISPLVQHHAAAAQGDDAAEQHSSGASSSTHQRQQQQVMLQQLAAAAAAAARQAGASSVTQPQQVPEDAAAAAGTKAAAGSAAADSCSSGSDDADYYGDEYWGLSPTEGAGVKDLEELEMAMGKSVGAYLPKGNAGWAASYPPRLNEVLPPEPDFEPPEPDFDFDADFDFDYEPSFDDDMFHFDVDFDQEFGVDAGF